MTTVAHSDVFTTVCNMIGQMEVVKDGSLTRDRALVPLGIDSLEKL